MDIVLDPVGGDRVTDSLRSLGPWPGWLLVVGFTGGDIPTIGTNRLLLNNVDVVGVGWGAWTMKHPGLSAEQWGMSCRRCWRPERYRPATARVPRWSGPPKTIASLENRSAKWAKKWC